MLFTPRNYDKEPITTGEIWLWRLLGLFMLALTAFAIWLVFFYR